MANFLFIFDITFKILKLHVHYTCTLTGSLVIFSTAMKVCWIIELSNDIIWRIFLNNSCDVLNCHVLKKRERKREKNKVSFNEVMKNPLKKFFIDFV